MEICSWMEICSFRRKAAVETLIILRVPTPPSSIHAQRRGSSRCSVCVKAKRGSCGTDNAVRGCIYRPGGPLPALQRGGSKTSMASGQLPPRPKSAPKPPLAKAASSKPPASKRKRVRVQRMTASTAAAAAALYQWHGRDPAALQAIIDTPPPAVPPLVAAGPPKPLPEPDASTLAEEQRVLKHYEEVMAQRKAFPKVCVCGGWWVHTPQLWMCLMCLFVQVEAEMHEKLRVLADAQRRLDDIIAQQAARAADRMQHHVDAPAQQAPLGDAEQQTPLVCMRAEVLSLGAFLFGPLAGASGAMSAPS